MLIVERQQRLIDLLRQRNAVDLDSLSQELGVSSSTVRRDLEVLEGQGLVERTHGGAVYKGPALKPQVDSQVLAERMNERVEEKKAIGAWAAKMVEPQMTVLIDGGSTVVYAARQITARPIQVVTTSLAVANLFADDDQAELIMVGGSLYPRTGVMIGPIATGTLADLHADILLFSLAGMFNDELFNTNMAMAQVEQVMMRQAARSVLLMDSSKFGRKSLARVCSVEEVDNIVTDSGAGEEWQTRLGDRLTIARSLP